jgi:hypothetical protein
MEAILSSPNANLSRSEIRESTLIPSSELYEQIQRETLSLKSWQKPSIAR